MRRWMMTLGVVVLLLLAPSARPSAVTWAQDADPGARAGHPVVGSWLADTDVDEPMNPLSLFTFHDDGTYFQSEGSLTGVGAWEPADEQTALLTFLAHVPDDAGNVTTIKVRATIEVEADGMSFMAPYTIEATGPDGTSSGEFGGSASGTRIVVEPMGTPVGPAAELFGGAAGTPEAGATPAG